ncbi:mucin TcMUCII [Reticulomyxa filosa]|uniref:Mucin TcMUCII n=1 Tax=Reticulomyxa filosa TaxID=46433 RepID=X6LRZ4_RETFI|nr:mucin TcMUCII [Reticulomyxa filosa]|eukprot:ETO04176.1 mucin TcMUCII [Reticulomyxa filosa]
MAFTTADSKVEFHALEDEPSVESGLEISDNRNGNANEAAAADVDADADDDETDFDFFPLAENVPSKPKRANNLMIPNATTMMTTTTTTTSNDENITNTDNTNTRASTQRPRSRQPSLADVMKLNSQRTTKQYLSGLSAMAASCVINAVATMFVQYVHQLGFESTEILFARGVTTATLLFVFDLCNHFVFGADLELPHLFVPSLRYAFWPSLRWILLGGLFAGLSTTCNYFALTKLSLGMYM